MDRFIRAAGALSRILAAGAAWLVSADVFAAPAGSGDQAAVAQVVEAACDKSVVILGEASHGDGHSETIKAALVEQLVSRCGFGGVLFEASYYEFLPIARNVRPDRPVSAEQVAAAVGGFSKSDLEMQPLFEFLARQASAGKIELGGLDFQAGGFEQRYGNDTMILELTAGMPAARRDACRGLYRSRLLGDDPPAGMTGRERDDALLACLASIDPRAAGNPVAPAEKSARAAQLVNLEAWLAASGQTTPNLVRARDAMMAENALRFIDGLPKPAKVVIWAHNGHAARHPSALPGYGDNDNLGQALGRRFENSLFALGITARGGQYRWSPGIDKPVPAPLAGSLEARGGDTTAFLAQPALQAAGESFSALFGHTFQRARWGDAFDAVLVLDAEYPPHAARP